MAQPSTFVVEIEFTAGVWTDVSAYLIYSEGVTIQRGRVSVLDAPQISTLSLALRGNDGRFTPGYNGGPYFPNVVPNKRIRVTVAGSVRFLGYIDRWEPRYPGGGQSDIAVSVSATCRMRLMARRALQSTYAEQARALSSSASVWPLDEAIGQVDNNALADVLGQREPVNVWTPKSYYGSATRGVDTGVTYSPKGLDIVPQGPLPSSSLWSGKSLRLPVMPAATAWTLAWWVKPYRIDGGTANYFSGNAYDPGFGTGAAAYDYMLNYQGGSWSVQHTAGGAHSAYLPLSLTGGTAYTPTAGTWMHIALTFDSSGGGRCEAFVNGVSVGSTIGPFSSTASPYRPNIGGARNESAWYGTTLATTVGYSPGNPGGTYTGVAYIPAAVSAADALALYNAGWNGFDGEGALARAQRLASYAGTTVPAGDADTLACGPLDTEGSDVVTLGQDLSLSAVGAFYCEPDGDLTWHNSRDRRASLTPAATFSNEADTDGGTFALPISEEMFANTITVTMQGGPSYTVRDAASVAAIGVVSLEATYNLSTIDQARDRAGWYEAAYGVPAPRISSLTVDMLTSSTAGIYTTVHALDLDSRIRITGLPVYGPASQVDAIIEGVTEYYATDAARVTFDCSPADVPGTVMIADNSGPYAAAYDLAARLDGDGTQTLNGAVTAVATSISVNVPSVAFTQTDVPFDIELDGERLTVTAAAAPSAGTQTLTVTRGVDGTNAVAHTGGTAVYLARNLSLGL